MSKPVAKISQASSRWQPDAILNRVISKDDSFAGSEPLVRADFAESRARVYSLPGDVVSGQDAADAFPGEGSSSSGHEGESARLAQSTGAEDQLSDPAVQDMKPAPSILDEESLRQEYDRGFDAGMRVGREEARNAIELEKNGVREFLAALNASLADPRGFFAPMESLAIHIAEQLIRGELSLSGEAIRRLVENALLEIEHAGERVTVRLNPEDLDKFSLLDGELSDVMEMVRDASLSRGSVKLEMSGGAIEDFIENRLDAMARSVLGEHADSHLNLKAGSPQTVPRDDMARFQAMPSLDKFSELVSSKTGNTLHADAFTVEEDEAGPAT